MPELTLDEIASREGFWEPESDDELNYCTHRLRKIGDERVVFRSTVAHVALRGFWLIVGTGAAVLAPLAKLGVIGSGTSRPWRSVVAITVIGGALAVLGVFQLRSAFDSIVFDKRAGLAWRVKGSAARDGAPAEGAGRRVRLADVVALQILSEVVRGKSRFTSHELNLVLRSGSRFNVVDHSKRSALEADARELGRFLAVPVLDGRAEYGG